jgi:hypothetical protein
VNALVIGVLLIVLFFAVNAAIWAAAPYLAVALIVVGIGLAVSKAEKKPPDQTDQS